MINMIKNNVPKGNMTWRVEKEISIEVFEKKEPSLRMHKIVKKKEIIPVIGVKQIEKIQPEDSLEHTKSW